MFFIPAVKKATEEFATRSNTVFNQLYSQVLNELSVNSEEFQNAKKQLGELVRRLNKHTSDGQLNIDRPQELTNFENLLGEELSEWEARIDVEVTPPDVESILKIGATVWVDDGIRTDIGRKGQGFQRALIFALVRTLANMPKRDAQEIVSGRRASRSCFFILEEPESFLHPQAQRAVFDSLRELATASQVIMCTHSDSFLSLDCYKSICRVARTSPTSPTEICQCTTDLFESADAKNKFNMVYWINPERSELFFAKQVVLVEGPTDKTIIPLLAKDLGLYKHDFTLIDCGSKEAIPQYIDLLNQFKIPYVVVYDKDHQSHKLPDAIAAADRSSRKIEQKILNSLGKSVILENDIEEELGLIAAERNKPYAVLQYVRHETFLLPLNMRSKIETIYSSHAGSDVSDTRGMYVPVATLEVHSTAERLSVQ